MGRPKARARRRGEEGEITSAVRKQIKDRLMALKAEWGSPSDKAFADSLGVKRTSLQRWLGSAAPAKTPGQVPSPAQLLRIAAKAKVSPSWLLLGDGPQYLAGSAESSERLEDRLRTYIVRRVLEESDLPEQIVERWVVDGADILRKEVELNLQRCLEGEVIDTRRASMGMLLVDPLTASPLSRTLTQSLDMSFVRPTPPLEDSRMARRGAVGERAHRNASDRTAEDVRREILEIYDLAAQYDPPLVAEAASAVERGMSPAAFVVEIERKVQAGSMQRAKR